MYKLLALVLVLLSFPLIASSESKNDEDPRDIINRTEALKFKLVAIGTILVAGSIGVTVPMLSNLIPALSPENNIFHFIKAFAAGVILSTGMVHILPDAFESLTSPFLKESPWRRFPFAGFIAMVSAIATLFVDSLATYYFNKLHMRNEAEAANRHEERIDGDEVPLHPHPHAHPHASGSVVHDSATTQELSRHRVISLVLELGIVVHSTIIGISLGVSQSPSTIKSLIAPLCFHQMFEGMGLGGSISQAKLRKKAVILMSILFSMITPIGIAIGIGLSRIYDDNSPIALIVQGVFNSASAGILIYMALVDLLAADFMSSKLQNDLSLQMHVNAFLILGAGCMSLLAIWA